MVGDERLTAESTAFKWKPKGAVNRRPTGILEAETELASCGASHAIRSGNRHESRKL